MDPLQGICKLGFLKVQILENINECLLIRINVPIFTQNHHFVVFRGWEFRLNVLAYFIEDDVDFEIGLT